MAERVETIGPATLILGDAREVVPTLADDGFDAVIADIPYGVVNRGDNGLRKLDKGAADVETFDLAFVVEQSARLAPSVYIWCGTEQASELRAGFVTRGMTTRLCGWEKTNPSPMNGEHLWLSSLECCIFARRSGAWFAERCASPVWRGPVEAYQVHPTQKPYWLMQRLVRASAREDRKVLDFCMGSGTTGVACIKNARAFVGVERDSGYFAIALERIKAAWAVENAPLYSAG
jgi:DNA modification methylase